MVGGVITEDDSTTKISKMIKNIGLYSTVKFFGGYENFKELYGEDISKKDKINFINQSIKEKTQVDYRNYIYVSDYLDDDIYYYKDENHSQIITYFYVGFVKINIYKRRGWTYVYDNSKKLPYEELTGDSLNSVFKTMLEIT